MEHNYVAIDFEMACYSKLSPCSIGVAVFDHGSLTESRTWLLKPADPGKFSFSHLHGITWDHVKNQATIKDIWYELRGLLHNRFIVAHNANFDLPILKENLEHYGIEYPNYYFGCTKNLAMRNFSHLKDYKLETICDLLSIEYGNHDSEADAISCGRIFAKMLKMHKHPEELFNGSQVGVKSYFSKPSMVTKYLNLVEKPEGGNKSLKSKIHLSSKPADMTKIVVDDVDDIATVDFFADKCCVVTGTFIGIDRAEVENTVTNYGGNLQSGVNSKTNYVIIGEEPGWSKIEKLLMLQESGQKIIVMDESEFGQVVEKIKSLQ